MDELVTTSDEGRKGVIKTLLKLFEDGEGPMLCIKLCLRLKPLLDNERDIW